MPDGNRPFARPLMRLLGMGGLDLEIQDHCDKKLARGNLNYAKLGNVNKGSYKYKYAGQWPEKGQPYHGGTERDGSGFPLPRAENDYNYGNRDRFDDLGASGANYPLQPPLNSYTHSAGGWVPPGPQGPGGQFHSGPEGRGEPHYSGHGGPSFQDDHNDPRIIQLSSNLAPPYDQFDQHGPRSAPIDGHFSDPYRRDEDYRSTPRIRVISDSNFDAPRTGRANQSPPGLGSLARGRRSHSHSPHLHRSRRLLDDNERCFSPQRRYDDSDSDSDSEHQRPPITREHLRKKPLIFDDPNYGRFPDRDAYEPRDTHLRPPPRSKSYDPPRTRRHTSARDEEYRYVRRGSNDYYWPKTFEGIQKDSKIARDGGHMVIRGVKRYYVKGDETRQNGTGW